VSQRYAETGLQRMRTGRALGKVFRQQKADRALGRPRDLWGFTDTPGADLLQLSVKPVRMVDLALWFGRRTPVEDLDGLLTWFREAFHPDSLDLIGTVILDEAEGEYEQVPFADARVTDAEVAEQLGAVPQAHGLPGNMEAIVPSLERRIGSSGFQLPPGLVLRVLASWLRGDIVVLVGEPGTGKTKFASLLGKAMQTYLELQPAVSVAIRADFDEAEFIGYERLGGGQQLRPFARDILDTDRPLDAYYAVLEEFNLATVETYLSSVLVAIQEAQRLVQLPSGEYRSLPVDTFILATCNSYIDDPETRTRVSAPAKRRAAVITMPNVLAARYADDGEEAVVDLAVQLIGTEQTQVKERADGGLASMFDPIRAAALDTVSSKDDLSTEARSGLRAIATALLDTPEGRSWFTMGLLRDLALAIAYAGRSSEAELIALSDAVADKIVPQLRGPHERADRLWAAVADLPGSQQIERLLDRMKQGPPEELLPLL
jgi:MoxR-like ATPase